MTSRCREIMKLADDTYNQYKCYGNAIANAVLKSLKAQKEFVRVDLLLTSKEKEDMIIYITTYIIELLNNKLFQSDLT